MPISTSGSDARTGHVALRRLGQHFLFDPRILARIAAAAEPLAGCTVLEVGPGPGGLTAALLATGLERLIAVERDPRWVASLAAMAEASHGRLEVISGDALAVDAVVMGGGRRLTIVANLPYNVGTALLLGWLERLDAIERMVLMFQKEVALRLTGVPGTAAYGRLAVLAQRLCTVERLFDLPPGAFSPPPKVSSSVVRLTPRPDRPCTQRQRALEAVTRAAFGQRRKMLRSSLVPLRLPSAQLLAHAGIDPTRRAETLTIPEYEKLADALIVLNQMLAPDS